MEAENHAGETALLRAVATGTMPVIKALLDEKSDVCHVNKNKQNVFYVCVKHSQLWTLNYLHHHICSVIGSEKAVEMLHAVDKDGNGLLECAAEAGDINVMEFLIRKGLNPYCPQSETKSTILHIAVSYHRMELTAFLLDIGCDINIKDEKGKTPLDLHAVTQDPALKTIILRKRKTACPRHTPSDPEDKTFHVKDSKGRSFAIQCPVRSNFFHLCLYSMAICCLLLLPIAVPFWAYFPLVGALGYGYKRLSDSVSSLKRRAQQARGRFILSPIQELLGAEEKFPAVWVGSLLACLFFCFCCIAYEASERNPFGILGVDSSEKYPELFWSAIGIVSVSIVSWISLVVLPPTPGLVDTRDRDFDTIMQENIDLKGSVPDPTLYCRTTLVRKPVRSKFCSSSGYVVARFDHYCIWLNTAIGFGNHRVFMMFLYSHIVANAIFIEILIRALSRRSERSGPAFVLGELLSQEYFFVTFLLAYILIVTAGLLFLTVEQTSNILRNVTTNERINKSRYAWMKGPDGRPFNRFDKGIIANVLDFLLIPGRSVDYYSIMDIPPAVKKDKKSDMEMKTLNSSATVNAMHSGNEHEQCNGSCDGHHNGDKHA